MKGKGYWLRWMPGVLLLLALLTACGTKAANSGPEPEDIYKRIQAEREIPEMVEMDDSFIRDYYGIDPALLDGYVFAMAADPVAVDTIIIMRAKEMKDAEALAGAAAVLIRQKSAEMQNYDIPEQYQLAAESEVKTAGTYIYLVISGDAEAIEAVIQGELEGAKG